MFKNIAFISSVSLSCKSESAKNVMTISEFMKFVDGQRDPRLNEILFPFCNSEKAQELIAKYEPNQFNIKVSKCHASGKIFLPSRSSVFYLCSLVCKCQL